MNSNNLDHAGPDHANHDQAKDDQAKVSREMLLQLEAERAEREGHAPGGNPDVDRYRLVVRALQQPLEPQLPGDFAVRVAKLAMPRSGQGFEDYLLTFLLLVMGIVALLFVGPAVAKAAQTMVALQLPRLPWHQLATAAVCVGLVWIIDSGWMRMHPTAR